MLLVSVHISDEIKAGDIEALQKQLNGSLGNLLAGCGITDELQIEVSIRKFNEPRIALIYINNRVLHTVPFFLAGDTWFFARDMHVEKNNTEVNVMSDLFFSHEDDAKMRLLHDYVCEAVKQNPQMLVSDDFAAELCAAAQMQRTSENITGIKNLLQYVLKYHISVNRFYTRINELQEKTVASLAEDIIESCKNKEIRIACQQQYLMDLVNEYNDGDNDIYKLVDEAMFYELGIDFPDVKFITDEDISYGRFKILVNDFETCAYKGLLPGEVIIQKADDYALPASVSKTQTLIHPANGNECWLFYSSQLTAPIEPQVWHPFAFMALHLVYLYRTNAALFFDVSQYRRILDDIEDQQPALIRYLPAIADDYFMCRVLRSLLEERISLRNILSIYQSVIDFDYIVADGIFDIVFDDRLTTWQPPDKNWLRDPDNYADFARLGLKDYISSSISGNSNSLSVFLLEQHTEKEITIAKDLDEDFISRFLEQIEIAIEENGNFIYPILTATETRKKLWRIMQRRFPGMRVLSYQELSSSMNITTIKRIAMDDITVQNNV